MIIFARLYFKADVQAILDDNYMVNGGSADEANFRDLGVKLKKVIEGTVVNVHFKAPAIQGENILLRPGNFIARPMQG